MDVVIQHGTLITPGGTYAADVGILGEQIAALGQDLGGELELDAAGCYVLPGGIDPHVHLHMPAGGLVSADDFASGTVAAALGGTTTLIDFVEPAEGQSLLEALAARQAEADAQVAIDYGLHMTLPAWHVEQAEVLGALDQVVAAGLPSFKLYLAYSGLRLDDVQLYRAMRAIGAAGGLSIVHCENGPLCEHLRAEALAQGDVWPIYHALTRPAVQEAEATSRAIDVAALANCPVYIVHVSCAEALERVRAARDRGQEVYAETCPHYLLLSGIVLDYPGGERLICSPPLRDKQDNKALWSGLVWGGLDVLATDHCPFTAAEKGAPADFASVPGGLPGVEARLGLAHHYGRLTLERWVEVCCAAPARLFGLTRKGHLAPGYDADLVIFDPERWITLEAGETLHERVDWSPYEGRHVQGWTRDVLSRGRVIVRGGEFVGEPGWGCFVERVKS